MSDTKACRKSELVQGERTPKPSPLPQNFGEKMKRDLRKTVRLNQDEFKKIMSKIEDTDLTFSDFAREALLHTVVKIKHTKHDKEFLYQLNKIGNNLNQLARAANSHDDKINILQSLVSIENALKELSDDS